MSVVECLKCGQRCQSVAQLDAHMNGPRAHLPELDGVCQVEDCEKPAAKRHDGGYRRWCSMHGKRREAAKVAAEGRLCSVATCERPVVQTQHYCSCHWQQLLKYGDVLESVPARERRLESLLCYAPGCERLRSLGTGRWCRAHQGRRLRYGQLFNEIPIPAKCGQLKAALAAEQSEKVGIDNLIADGQPQSANANVESDYQSGLVDPNYQKPDYQSARVALNYQKPDAPDPQRLTNFQIVDWIDRYVSTADQGGEGSPASSMRPSTRASALYVSHRCS